MKVICPGSFDPFTHGHLDIVTRAAALFDTVIVGLGKNSSKTALFAPEQRADMITETLAVELPGAAIEVQLMEGLLVDFCAEHGIDAAVKGVRFAADFDYELQMAQMNRKLSGLDTVLLPTSSEHGYISSSLVRDVVRFGGDISAFVPPTVARWIVANGDQGRGV